MTKAEFVAAIAEKTGATKKDVEAFIGAYTEVVVDAVKKGEEVSVPNLGKFVLKETKARDGINPLTKAPLHIPAKKMLAFKVAKCNKEF